MNITSRFVSFAAACRLPAILLLSLIAVLAMNTKAAPLASCGSGTVTDTINFTGAMQTYTVPAGVTDSISKSMVPRAVRGRWAAIRLAVAWEARDRKQPAL